MWVAVWIPDYTVIDIWANKLMKCDLENIEKQPELYLSKIDMHI